jgi:hypothetical protein
MTAACFGMRDQRPPIGLFIPFDRAWLAVKEFIETDGALPKSIDWIASADMKQSQLALKDLSRA